MRSFLQECYDDHFPSSSSSTTTSEERQPLQVAVQKEEPELHTARMIILHEQEKALFVAQHPELDRYVDGEAQQKLVELATEVSKWRQVYQEKTSRWFQGYGEGLKVTSSPHFAEEHRDEFHVACFFDGTILEEDVMGCTVGERIREAEAARDSSSSTQTSSSSSRSSSVQEGDTTGSSKALFSGIAKSFSSWGKKVKAAFL